MKRLLLQLVSPLRSAKNYIQRRLSLRLGLLIICVISILFSLVFGILFNHSKQYVRQVAINRAVQLLDNTVVRINGIMDETEVVTNYLAVTTPRNLHPDSLLAISRRAVVNYPFLTGMAISMEPYYFNEMGRYFSAYSLRQDDTITTVREGPFEYFEKVWYKTPRTLGTSCWVDAYDDYNEGTLSSKDILMSYCSPMRDSNGQFVGSVTASITLKWLSRTISDVKPYPNSSAIVVGRTGIYLVHPDTAKLYRETIFSDAAPEAQQDINALGKNMLAGHSGMTKTTVDGRHSYIFYRPLERTRWSIAIVCPENDVFSLYYQLLYTVWTIIGIGLLLLLLFCYLTIKKGVQPLQQLAEQAGRIADGHFDEPLPQSQRHDSVGRLTNSFILMQHSLAESVAKIKNVNQELERRNQELSRAYQLKMETSELKAAFIRNMSHQIRTPLNIISGFTQVLSSNLHDLPDDEVTDIMSRMKASVKTISHISWMLNASAVDKSQQSTTQTSFGCNEICLEAASSVTLSNPLAVRLEMKTEVPDSFTIYSDRQALLSILSELLLNANKFTHKGTITIGCQQTDDHTVSFSVTNTGIGIPADKRDRIFVPFAMLDSFSEGIGLGLSLCRHMARHLGGELVYDDSVHGITRFVVSIPVKS